MRKRLFMYIIAFIIISSCQNDNSFDERKMDTLTTIDIVKDTLSLDNQITETTLKNNSDDLLVVDSICVILYEPNESEIDLLREQAGGEDVFQQIVMDNQYYQSLIKEFFESKKIKIFRTEARVLSFVYSNDSIESIGGEKIKEAYWGAILFNKKDSPIIINGAGDFKKESLRYFGNMQDQ
jgi:hypothetical protein